MNLLNFIHLPSWAPFAGIGIAVLVAVMLLGAVKSLVGWPGLVVLALVLVTIGSEVDGARRALDFVHAHYRVKTHITDLPSVFW